MANQPVTLRPGDRNYLVGILQQQINSIGNFTLEVDNIFGPLTEQAVRDFQRRSGLPVTGVVDEATWRRLFLGHPLPAEVIGGDPPEFPNVGGYSIEVDIAKRQLTLYQAGVVQSVFPVAVGKPATPTPPGNYTIINKAVDPGGAFGTRWLGLTQDGIGIHGTNAPSSIGLAVSNGCIRMYNQDIESFFPVMNIGDPVRLLAGQVAGATYTVQPGDTLYALSQRFGVSVQAIMQASGLTSDVLYPGQVLFIPGQAAPPSPPPPGPPPTPAPGTTTYVVRPGDTLYLIARMFGTTLDELRRLNNLQGNAIYPGQTLLVPAAGVPRTYTVQQGDTLFTIAERFGTTVAELRRLNNLTSDVIVPGQVLRIR